MASALGVPRSIGARPSGAPSSPTCRASGCPGPGRRCPTRPRRRWPPRTTRTPADSPRRPACTQPAPSPPDSRHHRLVPQRCGRDERLRLAVLHDVARFFTGQVPVDRRQAQTRPLGRQQDLDELRSVGAHEGDAVPDLEPAGAQSPRQSVDVGIELGERAVPVGGDERRAVRDARRPPRDQQPLRVRLGLIHACNAHVPPSARHACVASPTRSAPPAPSGDRSPNAVADHAFLGSCENGVVRSLLGSLGSPSTRSPMMLRCTWSVPP